ncbi:protein kinase domain-containing protein [Pseudomonas thivervalensis]|jgi:eukaryotic-like serine/threonine-protein kinase|uniref:protein kinase domain-containing protein n=1 Tax=Pseudomonas thivervalensis TaxID=86265 RepID=UPI003D653B00
MNDEPNAAYRLEGLDLGEGWVVGKRIITGSEGGGSGGFFSVSYEVRRNGQEAFLKAFDIVKALQIAAQQGKTLITALQEQSQAFSFETALHDLCLGAKMRRVVRILAHGQAIVPKLENEQIFQIPYMIMELADGGDVRGYIGKTLALDIALKLTYLKDVASGILQLHKAKVAHQDLKPSNVMVFGNEMAKVGDLGRASSQDLPSMHDSNSIAGDHNYAPPEQLFQHPLVDWMDRRMRCDIYQFASVVTFVFFGTTVNLELISRLPNQVKPYAWHGESASYSNSLPFFVNAFDEALIDWGKQCPEWLSSSLIDIIRQCGTPDYTQRGCRKTLRQSVPILGLDRFVSELERLILRATIEARNSANNRAGSQ